MKRIEQIRFRGLRIDGKGWVIGYYWRDNSNGKHKITVDLSDDDFTCHEVQPSTISQFTGLKDKKGDTSIYEGDIICLTGSKIGNIHEEQKTHQRESNIIVKGLGTKDWRATEQKLLDAGCFYT